MLLAAPLNVLVLRSLADGPKQQSELLRTTGGPAQTTLRAQLKRLVDAGTIEKHRRNRFPGVLEYELTAAGRDLLEVAAALDRWLDHAPEGELELGGNPAKATIKALAEAWSTTMVRALAAGPLSLTDLDRVISSLSYPSLERRLTALRLAGLVEARPSNGRGTPYGASDWLRHAVAPILAAARWERRHIPRRSSPMGRLDAEAAFLLAVPLLHPPAQASGACRLAVELPSASGPRIAGVMVAVEKGRIESCTSRLEGSHDAWLRGSATDWLDSLVEAETGAVEAGGNRQLARGLLEALHRALFARELKASRA